MTLIKTQVNMLMPIFSSNSSNDAVLSEVLRENALIRCKQRDVYCDNGMGDSEMFWFRLIHLGNFQLTNSLD